jgi:hypothetical protein
MLAADGCASKLKQPGSLLLRYLSSRRAKGSGGRHLRPTGLDMLICLFSELRGQRCSSGGCPATAAGCRRVRKVQFGRFITAWPRPEHYRKRTCGPEPVTRLVLAAARYVSLCGPASVCASTVTCDNTRTCNSTWIVQRMPMSECGYEPICQSCSRYGASGRWIRRIVIQDMRSGRCRQKSLFPAHLISALPWCLRAPQCSVPAISSADHICNAKVSG